MLTAEELQTVEYFTVVPEQEEKQESEKKSQRDSEITHKLFTAASRKVSEKDVHSMLVRPRLRARYRRQT